MTSRRVKILWSLDARNDVSDIWDFYRKAAGRHTADLILNDIDHVCELLSRHPLAGRARDEIKEGFRSAVARPHVVFYRLTEDALEIVRVLDGRRDVDDIFNHET